MHCLGAGLEVCLPYLIVDRYSPESLNPFATENARCQEIIPRRVLDYKVASFELIESRFLCRGKKVVGPSIDFFTPVKNVGKIANAS
jgi:hypothetical protein